jgi:DegV family protein with EDD domain
MVRIITDSTVDLSPEIIEKHDIDIVPLVVQIGGKTYRDRIDITQQRLFELVEEVGELPKTAAPSAGAFEEAFSIPGEAIFISISSGLSATLQSAQIAAQGIEDHLTIIDSRNVSTGAGFLVLLAAHLRDQGASRQEIEQAVRETIPKLRTMFVIDTLRYLYMGGRCSAMESIVGSLLKIRPVIEITSEGTMGVVAKVRGARSKARRTMLDILAQDLPQLDRRRIFVTHSATDEDAAAFAEQVQRIASPDEITITRAGSVISSHCGPDTIGLLYRLQ